MAGKGSSYKVRRAEPPDASQLKRFMCGNQREPWTYEIQKLVQKGIRAVVKAGSDEASTVVAIEEDSDRMVGVICYGNPDPEGFTVHALGVVHDRRREGIATRLKRTAMADFASQGVSVVLSRVHIRNVAMQAVNERLGVTAVPDPDDPDYLLCMAPVEPEP